MMRRKSGKRESEKRKPNVGLASGRGPPSFGIRIPFLHASYLRVPTMSLLKGVVLFWSAMLRDAGLTGLGNECGKSIKSNVYNGSDANNTNDGNNTNNTQKISR